MKELTIEWRHFESGGQTCERCADTGENVKKVIDNLSGLQADGITVKLIETRLPAAAMEQSNLLLFNGTPLEDLLNDVRSSTNYCSSCSCLTGQETDCRTIIYEGTTYEQIPVDLLHKAAMKALAL